MRLLRRALAATALLTAALVPAGTAGTAVAAGVARPAAPAGGTTAAATDTHQVVAYGAATVLGPTPDDVGAPLVGITATPSGRGYWLTTATGGVLPFGDAALLGSLGDLRLNQPIFAMAATPSGKGYWQAASDGGVFTFGDATFFGSLGATRLNQPIVAMAPTPSGKGYWLAASDGGVFTFGDATFFGSLGATRLNQPIVAMAPTLSGNGYWLAASDGGVFTFGDATFFGSLGATAGPRVGGMAASATGGGYTLFGGTEGLHAFGDAPDLRGDAPAPDRAVRAGALRPDGGGAWLLLDPEGGQLPGGGRTLFPDHLLVAHYGAPGSPILGVLGERPPAEAAAAVAAQADAYRPLAPGRTVVPTFEVIATLALGSPGPQGLFSRPTPVEQLQPWLDAIRAVGGMLVLDIQPGRADALVEAKRYESLLLQPDVGLALDPEWTVGPTEQPGGGRIGSMDASTVNAVSAYLADLVGAHHLPEKVLVVHRFTEEMVTNAGAVVGRPGVAMTFHADGFGGVPSKLGDYHGLLPPQFHRGMKLFFDEDPHLFTPAEVMALQPQPDVVTYQ